MRWQDLRQSSNIDDRRGMGGRGIALGGGGIGVLILAVAVWLCGGDPSQLLEGLQGSGAPQTQPTTPANKTAAPDQSRQFVGAIMGSLEDAWTQILPQQSRIRYQDPNSCYSPVRCSLHAASQAHRQGHSTVRATQISTSIFRFSTSCSVNSKHPAILPRPM